MAQPIRTPTSTWCRRLSSGLASEHNPTLWRGMYHEGCSNRGIWCAWAPTLTEDHMYRQSHW
eukprot:1695443-Karenia_brevis.AAC.1